MKDYYTISSLSNKSPFTYPVGIRRFSGSTQQAFLLAFKENVLAESFGDFCGKSHLGMARLRGLESLVRNGKNILVRCFTLFNKTEHERLVHYIKPSNKSPFTYPIGIRRFSGSTQQAFLLAFKENVPAESFGDFCGKSHLGIARLRGPESLVRKGKTILVRCFTLFNKTKYERLLHYIKP